MYFIFKEYSETQTGDGCDRCPVCNGLPTTSNAACTCDRTDRPRRICKNCRCDMMHRDVGEICRKCLSEPYCGCCNRYLPPTLFESDGRCYTCVKKTAAAPTRTRHSVGQVVNEISIEADEPTFENFFSRRAGQLASVIEEYRQSLG